MYLLDLLRQFDPKIAITKKDNALVTGVTEDSRKVVPGNLFVARSGTKTDGGKFATDAIAKGAIAVVSESKIANLAVPQLVVPDAAAATSLLANAFYVHPSRTVKVQIGRAHV